MKNRNQLTRTCSACGIEKPLGAFLEISSTHGTHYGSFCATCRGAGITGKKIIDEENRETTVSTGSRIGAKERVFIEKELNKKIETYKENRSEQLNKRDTLNQEKAEKAVLKEKLEKDHRRTYLDLKKQPGFLGKKLPAGTISHKLLTEREQTTTHQNQLIEKQKKEEIKKIDNIEKEQKKTVNMMDQHIDSQAGEIRSHNPVFSAIQDSMGMTPYKLAKERLKNFALKHGTFETKKATEKKDPLSEFVENTWGPGSRRR